MRRAPSSALAERVRDGDDIAIQVQGTALACGDLFDDRVRAGVPLMIGTASFVAASNVFRRGHASIAPRKASPFSKRQVPERVRTA